jgi:hypothetical protein
MKLVLYVLLCGALLGASFALAGWAVWEGILYLIHHSQ